MAHSVILPDARIQPDWNVELEMHSLGRTIPTTKFWTSYTDASTLENIKRIFINYTQISIVMISSKFQAKINST